MGFVYVIKGGEKFKIGMTAGNNPQDRLHSMQCGSPLLLELVHAIPSDSPRHLEQSLHQKFADKRAHGEWFTLSSEDVEWLKSNSPKIADICHAPKMPKIGSKEDQDIVRLINLPAILTLDECEYWSGFYSHRAEHLRGECALNTILAVKFTEEFKSWTFTQKLRLLGAIRACEMFRQGEARA